MARNQRRGGGRAERLFLELLRPEPPRGCGDATVEELREAAALAFGHGLFLLVDHRIRAHAASFPPGLVDGAYAASIRQLRQQHITYALRYEREEREATSILEAAAIPAVILKGSAISRLLYGDSHCRTSADVDLLVRPGDVIAADAALARAGYRRDNDRPLAFWMRRLHHAVYRRCGSRLPVEIHWNFSIPGFFNLDPEEIWSGVELEGLQGRLGSDMSLLLLLMHHHLHGCTELRTLVDLLWAFERHGAGRDPGRLCERLDSAGLHVVAGIARLQVEQLWGVQLRVHDDRGSRSALRTGLLARAAGLALRPGRRPRASDHLLHALIQRLGLDSPRRVIASFTKTLLPSVAAMRALNGGERGVFTAYVRYYAGRLGARGAGNAERGRSKR